MPKKRLIIFDELPQASFDETDVLFDASEKYARCKGCFDCWLKTPGKCIIKDRVYGLADHLREVEELVIVSRCTYGGFSAAVKGAVDRLIAFNLPFFRKLNGELHHKPRYQNAPRLRVLFHGDATEAERACAESYVAAVGLNMNACETQVSFFKNAEEVAL